MEEKVLAHILFRFLHKSDTKITCFLNCVILPKIAIWNHLFWFIPIEYEKTCEINLHVEHYIYILTTDMNPCIYFKGIVSRVFNVYKQYFLCPFSFVICEIVPESYCIHIQSQGILWSYLMHLLLIISHKLRIREAIAVFSHNFCHLCWLGAGLY